MYVQPWSLPLKFWNGMIPMRFDCRTDAFSVGVTDLKGQIAVRCAHGQFM